MRAVFGFWGGNLWLMRQLYLTFPILHALSGELSWTHYKILVRLDDPDKRAFFMAEATNYKGPYTESYNKILVTIKEILKKKQQQISVIKYVLYPTLGDLMNDKVYKLEVNSKIFLVPLWHSETIYEYDDSTELIVTCGPILPNNITIDENNNIHYTISISLNNIVLNEIYEVIIGEKKYNIPINTLRITKEPQQVCLYNCGILEINDITFYDETRRSNIYFTILFRYG